MAKNTNTRPAPNANVTAADAFAKDAEYAGFTLEFGDRNSGSWNNILSFDPETLSGYAESTRTGQLYRFTVTGRVPRRGMVRVQITTAEDNGDAAGTVNFNRPSFGGYVNYFKFAPVRR